MTTNLRLRIIERKKGGGLGSALVTSEDLLLYLGQMLALICSAITFTPGSDLFVFVKHKTTQFDTLPRDKRLVRTDGGYETARSSQ